jgi:hypothetical protein
MTQDPGSVQGGLACTHLVEWLAIEPEENGNSVLWSALMRLGDPISLGMLAESHGCEAVE